MNTSYKVGLIVAAALCVVVLGYYMFKGEDGSPQVESNGTAYNGNNEDGANSADSSNQGTRGTPGEPTQNNNDSGTLGTSTDNSAVDASNNTTDNVTDDSSDEEIDPYSMSARDMVDRAQEQSGTSTGSNTETDTDAGTGNDQLAMDTSTSGNDNDQETEVLDLGADDPFADGPDSSKGPTGVDSTGSTANGTDTANTTNNNTFNNTENTSPPAAADYTDNTNTTTTLGNDPATANSTSNTTTNTDTAETAQENTNTETTTAYRSYDERYGNVTAENTTTNSETESDGISVAEESPETGGDSNPGGVPSMYTIAEGDTFSELAQRYYGSQRYWFAIARANPTVDPNALDIGQSIRLPGRASVVEDSPSEGSNQTQTPPLPSNANTHTVQERETLSTIAQQHYGDASRWREIYEANRQRIGADPDRISTGLTLRIPPAGSGGE